jgi:hypothetical protein
MLRCETSASFQAGNAYAEAFVGLGSMCVENVRLVKGVESETVIDLN